MSDYVFDGERFTRSLGSPGGERLQYLVLAYPAVSPSDKEAPVGDRVRALVADASFQLK